MKTKINNMNLPFPEPLIDKYRPKKLAEFIGLIKPKRVLSAFLANPRPTAWYFLGPSGIGKTTAALAVVDQLKAEEHHIPSKNCDLQTIQATIAMCHRAPWNLFGPHAGKPSRFHVVHISEADQITQASQIDLLSKMDATAWPPQTIFIFTANTRKGMEDRFMSRCCVLDFTNDAMDAELPGYLEKVYRKEGGEHPLDFAGIAKACQYNVRDALNKLEVELLLGRNRKGLPTDDLKILPEHSHDCEKCHKPWKHAELKCKLPHTAVCPTCGGGTIGSHRAQKAWRTIRKRIADELKQKSKRSRLK